MTDIELLTEPGVTLYQWVGRDATICDAARVSTGNDQTADHDRDAGLINYLMRHRHGSPFEHVMFTFVIEAPIFVFREFHRHRAGWSYNEMSGRYTELQPRFYVTAPGRPLINVGTSAKPEMVAGTESHQGVTQATLQSVYEKAWAEYQGLLRIGIAKEVARVVLPVGIMSRMYASCNARSLMHFISLRTHEPTANQVSRPQYEIEQVARKMEAVLAELLPLTYAAFVANGRSAP